MRAGIEVTITPEDRRRLEAIVRDRNAAQRHAAPAKVILATADGCGTMEVMRRSGLSKPGVWRWAGAVHARGRRRLAARQGRAVPKGAKVSEGMGVAAVQ